MVPSSLRLMVLVTLAAAGSWSQLSSAFVAPKSTAISGGATTTAARRDATLGTRTSPSSAATARSSFCSADSSPNPSLSYRHTLTTLRMSTAEAPEAPVAEGNTGSETQAPVDIPTSLPSDVGIDYVPLATMLATGDLKGADQFTRDALIKAAGAGSQKRDFVYWTEVKKIPNTDMATMENLWLKYSKGKFGYSVQKELWRKTKGDFENFCRRIGWTTQDSEVERKLRWFGANEFIYDVEKAPVGHLPLTSALRGTTLLKELMQHPVWGTEWQWE